MHAKLPIWFARRHLKRLGPESAGRVQYLGSGDRATRNIEGACGPAGRSKGSVAIAAQLQLRWPRRAVSARRIQRGSERWRQQIKSF